MKLLCTTTLALAIAGLLWACGNNDRFSGRVDVSTTPGLDDPSTGPYCHDALGEADRVDGRQNIHVSTVEDRVVVTAFKDTGLKWYLYDRITGTPLGSSTISYTSMGGRASEASAIVVDGSTYVVLMSASGTSLINLEMNGHGWSQPADGFPSPFGIPIDSSRTVGEAVYWRGSIWVFVRREFGSLRDETGLETDERQDVLMLQRIDFDTGLVTDEWILETDPVPESDDTSSFTQPRLVPSAHGLDLFAVSPNRRLITRRINNDGVMDDEWTHLNRLRNERYLLAYDDDAIALGWYDRRENHIRLTSRRLSDLNPMWTRRWTVPGPLRLHGRDGLMQLDGVFYVTYIYETSNERYYDTTNEAEWPRVRVDRVEETGPILGVDVKPIRNIAHPSSVPLGTGGSFLFVYGEPAFVRMGHCWNIVEEAIEYGAEPWD